MISSGGRCQSNPAEIQQSELYQKTAAASRRIAKNRASLQTPMPWKSKPVTALQRQLDATQLKLLRANAELELKTVYAERLEILLRERNEVIDLLRDKLEQSRQQIRRLDAEAERYAEMVRLPQRSLN
jgi:hypothetical protein